MPRFRTVLIGVPAVFAAVALVGASDAAAPAAAVLTASVVGHQIVIARGARRIFKTGWGSKVSPDGSQVVVTDYDLVGRGVPQKAVNPRLKLFAAAAGGPARRVIRIRCDPVWSSDSTKLAGVELNDSYEPLRLVLIDAANGATTTLVNGVIDTAVSFSPDSTKIAFIRRTGLGATTSKLQVIDLATRAVKTIRTGQLSSPVWGPSTIAFSVAKAGRNTVPAVNVAVVRPDGGGFRQLTNVRPNLLQGGLVPVAWSADGKRLLGGQGGQDTWLAYAIDPIRGGSRKISTRMTPAAISRDGNFVIGDTTGGEDFGPKGSNVVRAPWEPGAAGARVLLRNAKDPSYSG
jgi:hypothetical protein